MNIIVLIIVKLIKLYQIMISPLHMPCCRFHPTCSNYCIMAYKKYGFFRGSYLSIRRILRCQPFAKSGYDPLP